MLALVHHKVLVPLAYAPTLTRNAPHMRDTKHTSVAGEPYLTFFKTSKSWELFFPALCHFTSLRSDFCCKPIRHPTSICLTEQDPPNHHAKTLSRAAPSDVISRSSCEFTPFASGRGILDMSAGTEQVTPDSERGDFAN